MALTQVQPGMLASDSQYTGFKSRIINGGMVIDQRNAGASVTPTSAQYSVDRWNVYISQNSKFTLQQSTTAPAGFVNSLLATSSSAYTVGSGDYFTVNQAIEGVNTSDLAWGTVSDATVTLSFWVRSSLTGTFGGALQNNGSSRSYPFNYIINSANTWEQKTVTIAGDQSGSWATNTGTGILVRFSLGAGSTSSGTAGAWAGANYVQPTGAVSVVGTNGATFYITGVQLEKGSTVTSFDYRPYGTELVLCQRYFEVYVCAGNNTGIMPMQTGSTTSGRGVYSFKVQKRANPSSVTFAAANQYLYQGAGINSAPSAISVAVSSPSAVLVDVTISGATTYAAANLLENTTAGTNMISISAEL